MVTPDPGGLSARAAALADRFPFITLADLVGEADLVVLAPHPDDESLGCGGTIAAARAAGLTVQVVFASDGAASHPGSRAWPPPRLRALRRGEAIEATAALGVPASDVLFLDLPDGGVPTGGERFEAAVARVVDARAGRRTGAILSAWGLDPHCDHAAAAVLARALRDRLGAARLLFYPVWGWTLPHEAFAAVRGARLEIGAYLPRKRAAIAAHRSQLGGVVHDAPDGFTLDPAFLAVFDLPFETLLIP
jgi:LmbE family N-acetylglucosaminyl deacetylase